MCGIVGLIDPAAQDHVSAHGGGGGGEPVGPGWATQAAAVLARMSEAVAPRGPDSQGSWLAPGVALGHRRLKVIDLSDAAAQPIGSEDGGVQVVFNGEIYNFADLRAELTSHGHRFRSRADSEVLVHGYEQWGDGLLDRLSGMFAFGLWDARRRRFLAARDRLGKKPFYFAQVARAGGPPLFAFASELKGLLPVPGFARRIDPGALRRYLTFEYVPAPRSIFLGARKLDAGEKLVLDLGSDPAAAPRVERFWELPFPEAHDAWPVEPAAAELRTLLRRAVERRLVADVPVGAFLSGGIDSAAVTALMAEIAGADRVQTFSLGFADPSFDESAAARQVARHLHTQHHELQLDAATLLDTLPRVHAFLDEPLGDASIVPTYLLAGFTRQQVTVALSGDGGDELFAGYPTFQADRVGGLFFERLPPAARALAQRAAGRLRAGSGYFSFDFKVHQFLRGGGRPGPVRHQRWLASFLPEELGALLDPALDGAPETAGAGDGGGFDDPLADVARREATGPARHPFDRLMDFYARFYLANDVNVKVDRAAGAVGLEVRAPLQDVDLVTFACQLPPELRLRGLTTKYLLKHALRGRLPAQTLRRRKQGFAVPIARWLRQELRGPLLDELAPARIRREGFFQPAAVATLIDDHLSGRRDRRKQLWTLFMFQRWLTAWG
jgi:asparagine synthase (glutamine-hydrolysing)